MANRVLWEKVRALWQAFVDLKDAFLSPTSDIVYETAPPSDADLEDLGFGIPTGSRHRSAEPAYGEATEEGPVREVLKATARETLEHVDKLLGHLGKTDDAKLSRKYSFESNLRLSMTECPRFETPASIKVVNSDTLNVAVKLFEAAQAGQSGGQWDSGNISQRPILINFANYQKPGGGFMNGRMAQEEALCYRSSLSLSLHKSYYPLQIDEAIYSPYVLVVRGDYAGGHALPNPPVQPEDLPVVSVITLAALDRPLFIDADNRHEEPKRQPRNQRFQPTTSAEIAARRFAREYDRERTKRKMRLALRIAASHGHRMLVLGALGCGVYGNPPSDIAACWREVLTELEFKGHWWSHVYFAVYDQKNDGNFKIFHEALDGHRV